MHCSIHRHDKINQTFNNVTGKPTFFFGVRTTKYSLRTTIFWKVVVLRTTTFWSDFYGPVLHSDVDSLYIISTVCFIKPKAWADAGVRLPLLVVASPVLCSQCPWLRCILFWFHPDQNVTTTKHIQTNINVIFIFLFIHVKNLPITPIFNVFKLGEIITVNWAQLSLKFWHGKLKFI